MYGPSMASGIWVPLSLRLPAIFQAFLPRDAMGTICRSMSWSIKSGEVGLPDSGHWRPFVIGWHSAAGSHFRTARKPACPGFWSGPGCRARIIAPYNRRWHTVFARWPIWQNMTYAGLATTVGSLIGLLYTKNRIHYGCVPPLSLRHWSNISSSFPVEGPLRGYDVIIG